MLKSRTPAIHDVSVEFVCGIPLQGPVALELYGMAVPIPMQATASGWSVTIPLAKGVYAYRFRLQGGPALNDPRRSTQRIIDGEVWSVVLLQDGGPVWVERKTAQVENLELCRGISEFRQPLLCLTKVAPSDMPFHLWIRISNVFQEALLIVTLERPGAGLVFAGELVANPVEATPDFVCVVWLSFDIEPEHFVEGDWTFHVRVEGNSETFQIPFDLR